MSNSSFCHNFLKLFPLIKLSIIEMFNLFFLFSFSKSSAADLLNIRKVKIVVCYFINLVLVVCELQFKVDSIKTTLGPI